jgi:carbamoyltransferase
MIILGLNAFHGDSAAALIRDGKLIAAAEEERFRRIKHWAGFPLQAIAYCLREAGVTLFDVQHVAVNQQGKSVQETCVHRDATSEYWSCHQPT